MILWYAAGVMLLGAIAIFLLTGKIISGASPALPVEDVIPKLFKIRRNYFLILIIVLTAFLWLTLPYFPYPNANSIEPAYSISVTGKMWSWDIGPVKDKQGNSVAAEGGAIALPLGTTLEFQVTSADVNHGFGIYDAGGRLLAQTQAMPGYTNKLLHTFKQPGTYHVLCMEFCGLAHHAMASTISVK
jgi:cytochrome c oxidase subunit 2